jgi:hypothetical protein
MRQFQAMAACATAQANVDLIHRRSFERDDGVIG